ncbi:precorrin-3B C(17)-methyltransferase [Synechococcus sp. Nb3U1]|uniref:precorrin-3B C(17)-methyltransferase n=1 Tax=Synechococcus sp. Nb3U1 TaxID=1914529 RepID=UPI001F405A31|nr:precorrin-3B C(17)-methyltransferase [Synechococcus sp. Nb3U1]MCF2972313.1 precorrin-3B C(17)-methyltransferase [Synechococcus sp. Nb3U1]
MKLALFAPTPHGRQIAAQLGSLLTRQPLTTQDAESDSSPPDAILYWSKANPNGDPLPKPWQAYADPSNPSGPGSLSEAVAHIWLQVQGCLFVLATGSVVRLIAPLLQNKHSDPAVVVVDEAGRWVISLCGEHVGGADALARRVAAALGVEPVLTSGSEGLGIPPLDLLGDPYGWRRGKGDWTQVAVALSRGEPVQVQQTCGTELWRRAWPAEQRLFTPTAQAVAQIYIGEQTLPTTGIPTVNWHPRMLWVGIGCERGTSRAWLEGSLRQLLQEQGLAWEAIAGLATLAVKQDESGLLELAQAYDWPLHFFAAEDLAGIPVPHPSEIVRQAVGTPSVAEAAALLAAESRSQLRQKSVHETAAPQATLICPKRVCTSPSKEACTLAIARAPREYSPRSGHLWLIGTGPGELAQLTLAARMALTQADAVIGYQLYLDLIEPLLHPGQIRDPSPITQEIQRAERAITWAEQGLRVAVISSGDAGIYGMAGLVLQCLAQKEWDGIQPSLEVLPGISALQAAAAQLGSPLMHDFCAISLSDLLTPWPVIEKRLQAAATADFVVALYNPRSKQRLDPFLKAIHIFLQTRSGHTPVALARNLYRPGQALHLTTLADLDPEQVDMLTLVLIGNSNTFQYGQRLVTPRGYRLRDP